MSMCVRRHGWEVTCYGRYLLEKYYFSIHIRSVKNSPTTYLYTLEFYVIVKALQLIWFLNPNKFLVATECSLLFEISHFKSF